MDDDQHPFLGFAEHDLVARHVRSAPRHPAQINLDARARAGGRLARGTGQSRRAHVLNACDRARGQQFEAGFQHHIFHERVADLHRSPLLPGGFPGQILGRERRARQSIAPGGRSDVKDGIADALCGAARDLLVTQHTQAKGVDQRIAFVTLVETDLAGDRRNAEAVAVMRDAGHDAGEEAAVVCDLRFAICDFGVGACGESWSALTPALSPAERVGGCRI